MIGSSLTAEQYARLCERVDALPPMTDEQLDAVAAVLADIRLRRARRAAQQDRP
jgi:hypothetical protein